MKAYGYLKLLLVTAITITFFWQDLLKISKDAIFEWMPLSFALIFIAGFIIYNMRKPLNALLFLSTNKNSYGVVFLFISLLLYVAKFYMSIIFVNLLLAYAISFFFASLITLLTDYRIVKGIFVLFIALPFTIPPLGSFSNQPLELKLFSYFLGCLAITILAFQIIRLKSTSAMEDIKCEFCNSTAKSNSFCVFCGKQLSIPICKFRKTEILKVIPIIVLVATLLCFFIPVASLNENGARIEKYAWTNVEVEPILASPHGWLLNSSTRLVDYEKQFKEDYAIINVYDSAGERVSVLFEIAPGEPYVLNLWQLPGWQREIFVENFPITEQVYGKCYVLRKPSETIIVLRSRTLTYLFMQNSNFTSRKVGISVFMNFSRSINDAEIFETLKTLKEISAFFLKNLDYLRYWTERVFALNQIYIMSKDALLSAVAVVAFFSVAVSSRNRDHMVEKMADKVYFLNDDEMMMLVAAFNIKIREFTGKQLYEKLLNSTRKIMDAKEFYTRLIKLEGAGFFKRKLVLKGKNISLVWSLAF